MPHRRTKTRHGGPVARNLRRRIVGIALLDGRCRLILERTARETVNLRAILSRIIVVLVCLDAVIWQTLCNGRCIRAPPFHRRIGPTLSLGRLKAPNTAEDYASGDHHTRDHRFHYCVPILPSAEIRASGLFWQDQQCSTGTILGRGRI